MRIWDDYDNKPINPECFCRQHLLGVHNESHSMYSIITKGLQGFRNHPETKRWVGRLPVLKKVHDAVAKEMTRRGYNHKSPMLLVNGSSEYPEPWQPVEVQHKLLRERCKECEV